MQREHGVQNGTGVCQESKTCPHDSRHRWPIVNSKDFWRDLRNSTYHSWTYAY